jgi:hypothetical protein
MIMSGIALICRPIMPNEFPISTKDLERVQSLRTPARSMSLRRIPPGEARSIIIAPIRTKPSPTLGDGPKAELRLIAWY